MSEVVVLVLVWNEDVGLEESRHGVVFAGRYGDSKRIAK